jgi:Domain of unknown function (DUF4034)
VTLRLIRLIWLTLALTVIGGVSAQTTPAWRDDRAPCQVVHPWVEERLSAIPAKFRNLSPEEMRSFGFAPPPVPKRWPHSGAAAQRIQRLLTSGCFELLDRSFEELNENLRYEQNDEWVQPDFPHAMQWIKEPNRPDLELLEEWKKRRPASAFVHYVEAAHWFQVAWNVRGFGAVSGVSTEKIAIFRENLFKSHAVLQRNKHYIDKYPLFAIFNLTIQASDPGSFKSLHQDFLSARKRWPTYIPLYGVRGNALTPKWGGSLQTFHEFVKENASFAYPGSGKDGLARLYSAFLGGEANDAAAAYWLEVRASYEAWSGMPESDKAKRRQMLSAYKSAACFVKDKDATTNAHLALVREKLLDAQSYKPELDSCLRLVSERS